MERIRQNEDLACHRPAPVIIFVPGIGGFGQIPTALNQLMRVQFDIEFRSLPRINSSRQAST